MTDRCWNVVEVFLAIPLAAYWKMQSTYSGFSISCLGLLTLAAGHTAAIFLKGVLSEQGVRIVNGFCILLCMLKRGIYLGGAGDYRPYLHRPGRHGDDPRRSADWSRAADLRRRGARETAARVCPWPRQKRTRFPMTGDRSRQLLSLLFGLLLLYHKGPKERCRDLCRNNGNANRNHRLRTYANRTERYQDHGNRCG